MDIASSEHIQRDNQKLTSLLAIASTLNSSLQIDHLLPIIMISARDLLEAEASSLFLIDQKHNSLFCEVAIGEKGKIIKKFLKLENGEGIAGWVAQEKKSLLIEDAYEDHRFDSTWDKKSGFTTKSIICIPLYLKNTIIGTLEVINKVGGSVFNEADRTLLEHLGNLAAVALDNAKTHDSLRVKIRELSLLTDFERKVALGWGTDRLIQWVIAQVIDVVEAQGGSVMIFDEGNRNLLINASAGFIANQVTFGENIPFESGIIGISSAEKRAVLIKNIHADARCKGQPVLAYESSSMICAPLLWQDDIFGFIVVNEKSDGYLFTRDDVSSVRGIAERLSMVLKTSNMFKQMKKSTQEEKSAAQLMEKILPQSTPTHPRLSIHTKYIPYHQVGGDFYRFFDLGHDKYGVLVVDVSGHGLSAALISVMVNTMLSTIPFESLHEPARFFNEINTSLQGRLGGNFLTAFYAIIDVENNKVSYANAGHTEGVYYKKSEDAFIHLNAKGPLLGVWPDPYFEQIDIEIHSGDRMFIYTDGLLELVGENSMEMIDESELRNILRENLTLSGKNIRNKIIDTILKQTSDSEFNDDVTLIIIDIQ
ncbi:MAG: GAF domain-containing SpoIIE family protein phosphatase [Leptospirales bacterium]